MYDYENDKGFINCRAGELYGTDRYQVEKGVLINDWDERVSFYYNPMLGNKFSDYLANDLAWFIVSPKFKKVLQDCKIEGVQYFPVNVINDTNGSIAEKFYLVNICNLVDAIDLEHSKYSEFSVDNKKVISVKKYALNKDKLGKEQIFRLKGSSFAIFVSENIKKAIGKNKITGCDFLEIKVY